MSVPLALADPDLRRYRLRRHRFSAAGGALSVVAPASVEAVLSTGQRPGRVASGAEPMPYWAEVWPASLAIARLLARGPSLGGCKVLDVGCGLGVAAAAAARRGGTVVLLDRNAEALRFARFNAVQNGAREPGLVHGDWSRAVPDGPFDLVLLSDVTYEREHCEPLLRLLRRTLAPRGRALHVDPEREASTAFLARAALELEVVPEAGPPRRTNEGLRLVWLRRRR